ncbi:hypothetical protein GALL_533810 [mine drainage metagenome]|uniref:Uncharacterized protein n=1 Tax=mine drainage metagenome TaxID=410659 RepID=A0A1J5P1S7_9ZZZZ
MGKIGAVDDHEDVRLRTHDRADGFPDKAQHLRQLLHDRRQADDRELFDRKQRRQPLARHRLAADALEPHRAAETLT